MPGEFAERDGADCGLPGAAPTAPMVVRDYPVANGRDVMAITRSSFRSSFDLNQTARVEMRADQFGDVAPTIMHLLGRCREMTSTVACSTRYCSDRTFETCRQ